jgi:hypothetical protein
MILVRTYNGGGISFRTQRGTVHGRLSGGFIVVDVDPIQGRIMRRQHRFHAPPAGFSLETQEKAPPKVEAAVVKKPEEKKAPPRKRPPRKRPSRKKASSSK